MARASFRRVTLSLDDDRRPAPLDQALSCQREGRVTSAVLDGWNDSVEAALRATGAKDLQIDTLSLEDVFVEVVQASKRAETEESAA